MSVFRFILEQVFMMGGAFLMSGFVVVLILAPIYFFGEYQLSKNRKVPNILSSKNFLNGIVAGSSVTLYIVYLVTEFVRK